MIFFFLGHELTLEMKHSTSGKIKTGLAKTHVVIMDYYTHQYFVNCILTNYLGWGELNFKQFGHKVGHQLKFLMS